jgi:hypothetical protein
VELYLYFSCMPSCICTGNSVKVTLSSHFRKWGGGGGGSAAKRSSVYLVRITVGHSQLVLSPFFYIPLFLHPSSPCLIISAIDNGPRRIVLLFNNFSWRLQMQLRTFQFV